MKENLKPFAGYQHIIKGIPVISLINFNNYMNGYMSIEDLRKCVFMVPTILTEQKIKHRDD